MDILFIIVIICTFAFAFSIGAGDESTSPLISAGAMKLKPAILIGGVFAALGTLLFSENVAKTVGSNLLSDQVDYSLIMMLAVIVSTTAWVIFASKRGVPVSVTHTIIGAIFGAGVIFAILNHISILVVFNWSKFLEVLLSWIFSPILGFSCAAVVYYFVTKLIKRKQKGLEQTESLEKVFKYLLIIAVFFTCFSRGGNDSAKAIGIFYGLLDLGLISDKTITLFIIITACLFILGLFFVGRNVVQNVGVNLVELKPSDAFSIQLSASIVLFAATVLGLPVSGAHILIFAIIGVGWMKAEKPDRKSLQKMIRSWILTFPVAALLAMISFLIFCAIF